MQRPSFKQFYIFLFKNFVHVPISRNMHYTFDAEEH